MEGARVVPDLVLSEAAAGDYVAVAFIGGSGSRELFSDADAIALARGADAAGLTVAAICMAPAVLAAAGVLEGVKATCDPAVEGELRKGGAIRLHEEVVVDGNIVTASGPPEAEAFGAALVDNITRL